MFQKPFRQWTVTIALSITTTIASEASGTSGPAARNSPPPSSLAPAARGMSSGMRKPSASNDWAVRRVPLPPSQPNEFLRAVSRDAEPEDEPQHAGFHPGGRLN